MFQTKTNTSYEITATVTRKDGTVENLGVIATNFTWKTKLKLFFKKVLKCLGVKK
jgi:hypothetical protein